MEYPPFPTVEFTNSTTSQTTSRPVNYVGTYDYYFYDFITDGTGPQVGFVSQSLYAQVFDFTDNAFYFFTPTSKAKIQFNNSEGYSFIAREVVYAQGCVIGRNQNASDPDVFRYAFCFLPGGYSTPVLPRLNTVYSPQWALSGDYYYNGGQNVLINPADPGPIDEVPAYQYPQGAFLLGPEGTSWFQPYNYGDFGSETMYIQICEGAPPFKHAAPDDNDGIYMEVPFSFAPYSYNITAGIPQVTGITDLEDFNSTLYFYDNTNKVQKAVLDYRKPTGTVFTPLTSTDTVSANMLANMDRNVYCPILGGILAFPSYATVETGTNNLLVPALTKAGDYIYIRCIGQTNSSRNALASVGSFRSCSIKFDYNGYGYIQVATGTGDKPSNVFTTYNTNFNLFVPPVPHIPPFIMQCFGSCNPVIKA